MKKLKNTVDRLKEEFNKRCETLYSLLDKAPIEPPKNTSDDDLDERFKEVHINTDRVRLAAEDLITIIKEIKKL